MSKIHELIYNLGTSQRNPSLLDYFLFLKESDNWSKEALLEYQFKKCKSFLTFAFDYSPYYTSKFQEIDFQPESFLGIDDLKRIPPMDKATLLKYSSLIHSVYPFK